MPYRSANAPHIANLMLRRGDIEARRAQGGQAWGQAAQNIGRTLGDFLQQRKDYQDAAPDRAYQEERRKFEREGMDATRAERARVEAAREIIAAHTDPRTGKSDPRAITAALTQAGLPDLARDYEAEATAKEQGLMARGILQAHTKPDGRLDTSSALQTARNTFAGQLPESLAWLESRAAEEAEAQRAASEDANARGLREMAVSGMNAGVSPEAVNRQQWAETGEALPASLMPKAPEKGPNSQQQAFRLNGQDVLGDYIPGPEGGRYMYQGRDVTGQDERVPPASQSSQSGEGRRSRLVEAVIENPVLWDSLTPSDKGDIAGDLSSRGFDGFGRPLSDAAIGRITDARAAIASAKDLRAIMNENEQYIGPVAGLAALNPYSEARKVKADVDRVRQRVGKALEGGVLRKEDEEKYKLILATLTDEPSTAIYKIDGLIGNLEKDIELFIEEQTLAGRRAPRPSSSDGRRRVIGPNGETGTVPEGSALPDGWRFE